MTHCVAKALLATGLVLLSVGGPRAYAAPPPTAKAAESPITALTLEAGSGRVLSVTGETANIFVADPKIAEVRPASPTSLFIFGITAGHTTVAALDTNGHLLVQYQVTVHPSAFGAREAQGAINRLVPGGRIQVQAQGKGLMLTGVVKNPADAAQAVAIAKGYAADGAAIDNEISIDSPLQVNLSVRVAQMTRDVKRNMGINWDALGTIGRIGTAFPALTVGYFGGALGAATGGGAGLGISGLIDALANDNLVQVLAEPNLTVMSGQQASFQVGGEFPIPIASQNNTITVTYKNFGVMLSFVPTVLTDGRINLHVKPEVSEIGTAVVNVGGGLSIPSLVVRRAETTVELGSGESFAIAGLLQQNTNDNSTGITGLRDIPGLGALFNDGQFKKSDTELVIVVTPYIVRPVGRPSALHLPTDGYAPAPDIQRLFLMRQVAQTRRPVPIPVPGNAGFIVQ